MAPLLKVKALYKTRSGLFKAAFLCVFCIKISPVVELGYHLRTPFPFWRARPTKEPHDL